MRVHLIGCDIYLYLKKSPNGFPSRYTALFMTVSHIIYVTQQLQFMSCGRYYGVETISNEGNLLVVIVIGSQKLQE